jgi:sugar phosphate permease
MQSWTPVGRRGFAQGLTHAFARLGNAVTPPIVAVADRHDCVARIVHRAWLLQPGVGADLAGLLPRCAFGASRHHRGRAPDPPEPWIAGDDRAAEGPWGALTTRMAPVTIVYFCYGWSLWLYLTWLPSYFLHEYQYDLKKSALFTSAVFFAGVVGDYLGGEISDRILHRTGDLQKARRNVVMFGFLGSFVCLVPVFLTHDLVTIILSLGAAFFCAEIVIGPMWSIPMDIAGKFSGTAAGMMNTGSALAAILSPIAFGYIIDATGNWQLPFAGSLGFLLLGAVLAPHMHPERAFDESSNRVIG